MQGLGRLRAPDGGSGTARGGRSDWERKVCTGPNGGRETFEWPSGDGSWGLLLPGETRRHSSEMRQQRDPIRAGAGEPTRDRPADTGGRAEALGRGGPVTALAKLNGPRANSQIIQRRDSPERPTSVTRELDRGCPACLLRTPHRLHHHRQPPSPRCPQPALEPGADVLPIPMVSFVVPLPALSWSVRAPDNSRSPWGPGGWAAGFKSGKGSASLGLSPGEARSGGEQPSPVLRGGVNSEICRSLSQARFLAK